jgi:TP901 family phage tail tape measure protein
MAGSDNEIIIGTGSAQANVDALTRAVKNLQTASDQVGTKLEKVFGGIEGGSRAALASLNTMVKTINTATNALKIGDPARALQSAAQYGQSRYDKADMSEISRQVGNINRVLKLQDDYVKSQKKLFEDGIKQFQNMQRIQANSQRAVDQQNTQKVSAAYYPQQLQNRFFSSTEGKDQIADVRISAQLVELDRVRLQITQLTNREKAVARAGNVDEVRQIQQQITLLREREAVLQNKATTQRSLDRVAGTGALDTFKIQGALLANYAIMGGLISSFSQAVSFSLQFENSLKELQAIAALTNTELQPLAQNIIAVANSSRFSALEVTKAATTLAQAGFSGGEIQQALDGVVKLALATGTDLNQSVDLATSAIGAFNLSAGEMGNVTNILTAATNQSKLTIDKLSLGFQYSANTANEAGLSVSELTSALGVMSNAGIRSGSTLGTGMRQILTALLDPSDKFVEVLHRIGLTTEDISLKTHTFADVLKTLRDAGFTAEDGLKVFETRAAAAFSALLGRVDQLNSFNQSIVGTNAAAKASSVQMESLMNIMSRLGSVLGSTLSTGFQPVQDALKAVALSATSFLIQLAKYPGVLKVVTTALAAFAGAISIKYLFNLIGGIQLLTSAWAGFNAVVAAPGASIAAIFTPAGLAITALTAVFGGLIYALSQYHDASEVLDSQIDKQTGAVNTLTDTYNDHKTTLGSINSEYDAISARQDSLRTDQEAFKSTLADVTDRFGALDASMFKNIKTVDDLLDALQRLATQMAVMGVADLQGLSIALDKQIGSLSTKANGLQSQIQGGSIVRDLLNVQNVATPRGGRATQFNFDEIASLAGSSIEQQTLYMQAKQLGSGSSHAELQKFLNDAARLQDTFVKLGKGDQLQKVIDLVSSFDKTQSDIGIARNKKDATDKSTAAGVVNDVLSRDFDTLYRSLQTAASGSNGKLQKLGNSTTVLADATANKQQLDAAIIGANDRKNAILANPTALLAKVNELLSQGGAQPINESQLNDLIKGSDAVVKFNDQSQMAREVSDKYKDLIEKGQAKTSQIIMIGIEASIKDTTAKMDALNSDSSNTALSNQVIAGIEKKYTEARKEATAKWRVAMNKDPMARLDLQEELTKIDLQEQKDKDDVYNKLKGIRQQQADTARQNRDTTLKTQLANQTKDLTLTTKYFNPAEGFAGVDVREAAGEAVIKQIEATKKQILDTEFANPRLSSADKDSRLAQFKEEMDNIREEFSGKIVGEYEQVMAYMIKLIDKQFKDVKNKLGLATLQAQGQVKLLQDQNDARTNPINRGKVSTNLGREYEKQLYDLQTKVLEAQIAENQAALDAKQALADKLLAKIQELADRAAKATTPGEKDAVGAAVVDKAKSDYEDQAAEIARLQEQIDQLKAELGTRTKAMDPETAGQALKNAANYAASFNDQVDSLSVTLENTLVAGIDAADAGLSKFFQSNFTNIRELKRGFKDLAISILQAMQKVLADQAAKAFIGMIGSLFSDSSGSSPSGFSMSQGKYGSVSGGSGGGGWGSIIGTLFSAAASFFNEGGLVHANSGYHVSGRDSVPAMLRPDEYVLRKSAVDLVGVDNLDMINSLGNSTISKSKPAQMTPANSNNAGHVNVWLVPKDSVPPPGPRDIVQAIGDDIVKGGTIKKLIKQVNMGNL